MSIEIEYKRWDGVYMPLYKKINAMMHNFRQRYEFKNIFERFMIRVANEAAPGEIYIDVDLDHPVYMNLLREINEKHLMGKKQAKTFMTSIQQRIHHHLEQVKTSELTDAVVTKTERTYRYRKFRLSIDPVRNDCFEGIPDEQIMKMLIRYSLMFPGGQQWNLPREWYQTIVEKLDVTIEGFASPLNSQLMLFQKEPQFCSVFPDTDEPFGSLGSIFNLTPDQVEKQVIMNNPPYVLEIMNRLMDLQAHWLSTVPMRIIMCVPAWEDAEYYQSAMDNKYLKYEERLEPNRHYYETIKRGEMAKITAKFPSHIFVFSSHKKEKPQIVKKYPTVTDGWRLE